MLQKATEQAAWGPAVEPAARAMGCGTSSWAASMKRDMCVLRLLVQSSIGVLDLRNCPAALLCMMQLGPARVVCTQRCDVPAASVCIM
jgi:hypothetical protein